MKTFIKWGTIVLTLFEFNLIQAQLVNLEITNKSPQNLFIEFSSLSPYSACKAPPRGTYVISQKDRIKTFEVSKSEVSNSEKISCSVKIILTMTFKSGTKTYSFLLANKRNQTFWYAVPGGEQDFPGLTVPPKLYSDHYFDKSTIKIEYAEE